LRQNESKDLRLFFDEFQTHHTGSCLHNLVLKGHDFSRAVTEAGKSRTSAPEGVTSGKQKTVMKQLLASCLRSSHHKRSVILSEFWRILRRNELKDLHFGASTYATNFSFHI